MGGLSCFASAESEVEHGDDRNRAEPAEVHEAQLESELLRQPDAAADAEPEIGGAVVVTDVELPLVLEIDVGVEQPDPTERIGFEPALRRERILRVAHDAEDVDRHVVSTDLRADVARVTGEIQIAANPDGPIGATPPSAPAERDSDVVWAVAARDAAEQRPLGARHRRRRR